MDVIRVMLVDDCAIFLHAAVRFLEAHRELVVVGTARNGQEALDQAFPLQPDVILLDVNMPGLSGLEVLPHLRALLPTTRIIVWAMCDFKGYRRRAAQKQRAQRGERAG
jgi:DNA-binding NarL/FixJ family response regulator